MFPKSPRFDYEKEHGSYAQPAYFFRKFLARLIPLLPAFKMRLKAYRFIGVKLEEGVKFIGLGCHIDDQFPELISIGSGTVISFDTTILAHDDARHTVAKVEIGRGVFIGTRAIILPGVSVGDGAIIGAGAVVSRDIPSGAIATGVPAKIRVGAKDGR